MPGIDDQLTDALQTVELRIDTLGVVDRVTTRRRRRQRMQRLRVPALALALVVVLVALVVVQRDDSGANRQVATTDDRTRTPATVAAEPDEPLVVPGGGLAPATPTTVAPAGGKHTPAGTPITVAPSAPDELVGPPQSVGPMSFLDADNGWAINGMNADVLATDDGGATYRVVGHVDPYPSILQFVDGSHGWAAAFGPYAMRTVDGGRTWARMDTGSVSIRALRFADPQHGWVVGSDRTIIGTTDGGVTWTRQTVPSGTPDLFNAVDAVGTGNVWATLDSSPTILHSADGGATWATQTMPGDPAQADLVDVDFVSPTLGWALSHEGAVFTTVDGGATWTRKAVVAAHWQVHIKALDDRHLLMIGDRPSDPPVPVVLASDDGGATWAERFHRDPPIMFGSFDAVSPTHIWVSGGDGMWRTSDGTNWGR